MASVDLTMLIIAGHVTTDPELRDDWVASFAEMTRRARAYDGCLDLAVTADVLDPGRVNIVERWASEEALERWRAQADPPAIDAPLHSDHVRRFDVTAERDPFG